MDRCWSYRSRSPAWNEAHDAAGQNARVFCSTPLRYSSLPSRRIPKLAFARIDDFCEFVVGKHQVSDIKLPLRSVQHFFAKNYALGTESTSC
jgi:hypothetical protein